MRLVQMVFFGIGVLGLVVSVSFSKSLNIELYNKALGYYKNGDYKTSYTLFKELYRSNLDNINVNYYYGRSSFYLNKYEESISAFDRILINKPNNLRARLELARAYFKIGNFNDAKREFQKILKHQISYSVKENIKKYIIAIETVKKRNFLSGALIAGIGYDSNLYNSPDSNNFYIPSLGSSITNTTTDDSDWYHQEILAVDDVYDFGDIGSYAFKNNFVAMNKTLKRYSSKNIVYLMYSPAIIYKSNRYGYDISFLSDKMWYGSEPYMYTYAFNPKLWYKINDRFIINSAFKYQKKIYSESINHNNDAKNINLKFNSVWRYRDDLQFNSGISFERERKVRGSLTNIDYDKVSVAFNGTKSINALLKIGLDLSYSLEKYKDFDATYLNKREDKEYVVGLNSLYRLSKNLLLKTNIAYIKNDSNQDASKYDKYTFGINIIKPF